MHVVIVFIPYATDMYIGILPMLTKFLTSLYRSCISNFSSARSLSLSLSLSLFLSLSLSHGKDISLKADNALKKEDISKHLQNKKKRNLKLTAKTSKNQAGKYHQLIDMVCKSGL